MLKRAANWRRSPKKGKDNGLDSSQLTPVEEVPKKRVRYGTSEYAQSDNVRVESLRGRYVQMPDEMSSLPSSMTNSDNRDQGAVFESSDPYPNAYEETIPEIDKDRHKKKYAKKKWNQAHRWKNDVVPKLIYKFYELQRRTEGFRRMSEVRGWEDNCQGCNLGQTVDITLMCLEDIQGVTLCTCTPIAEQLLQCGFFPCAPLKPSLAVDVNLLDLTTEAFANLAPNLSGWSETLEAHLLKRGYSPGKLDTLRRRFGNALKWFNYLVDKARADIDQYIEIFLQAIDPESSTHSQSFQSVDRSSAHSRPADDSPSGYLRRRCPICFGGNPSTDEVCTVIVQLDGNFTQKRRQTDGAYGQDTPRTHPETVFLSKDKLTNEEAEVNRKRPQSVLSQEVEEDAEGEDTVEPGMKVPRSVLYECGKSFNAADEKRQATSTSFFSDKGLMALLCRHDRVLWLANVTSPGERQFYAFALIRELFKNLPLRYKVGLLYDIACQVQRSCVKWDFLPEYRDRIFFAVSIFHAYGHQWACQVIYHPRKCSGFGLSDGEGCERFWSQLKLLIPTLRVSGFYHRLYCLDARVKKMDERSLFGAGIWIRKKWKKLDERILQAEKDMAEARTLSPDIDEEILSREWDAQVLAQTKPIPRYRRGTADKKIHHIIALKNDLSDMRDEEVELEDEVRGSAHRIEERRIQLVELRKKKKKTSEAIQKLMQSLSTDGRYYFQTLLGNEFLETRIRALALKQRIRSRICDRRFEVSQIERASRNHANVRRLHTHVQEHVKRRDPTVASLVRRYNSLCDQLDELSSQGKAPPGLITPSKIDLKGLFQLDVDDEIWEDAGLDDRFDDRSGSIPRWMGDEGVRKGIKAFLLLERCKEERRFLLRDRASIQEWLISELRALNFAIRMELDNNIGYVLGKEKDRLMNLARRWKHDTEEIPYTGNLDNHLLWPDIEDDMQGITTDLIIELDERDGEEDFDDDEELLNYMQEAEVLDSLEDERGW